MGDPKGLDDLTADAPPFEDLQWNTHFVYGDLDAGPTKAWMIHHRAEPTVEPLFQLGFGKRPQEELYELGTDPHYMKNVAHDPAYATIKAGLYDRLMALLHEEDDPRVTEKPCRFEDKPYAGPVDESWF